MTGFAHITRARLDDLSAQARSADRLRAHLLMHRVESEPQQILIAIEPGSYVRPHLHPATPAWTGDESLTVLRGHAAVLLFDLHGSLLERITLGMGEYLRIPGGHGHSLAATVSGTVVYEVKPGNRPDPDRTWLPGTIDEADLPAARAQALAWTR